MKLLRVLRTLAVSVVVLIGLAAAFVYSVSEWKLQRSYAAPFASLHPTTAPDSIEGKRMARIVGCWEGCHGRTGQGGHWGVEGIATSIAPTLSDVLPQYSDEELVRLIRYGVKRDGKSAVGMISYTFWPLGDQDLANIIVHLRAQPIVPPMERKRELSWLARLALVTGRWGVSAEQVDRARPRWGNLPRTTPFERGRYLASITCSECHGLDFKGNSLEGGPSLAILGGYSPQDFRHLIRTAQPVGGRKLNEEMDWVINAPFTDAEISDLYQFLREHHGIKGSQ